jgi:histidinol-phosphate aminotransferase
VTSSGVHVRSALAEVPSYVPGRTVEQVAAAYGLDRVVKLASNEAAHGPLPGVLEEAARQAAETHRYPDTESSELRRALAGRAGVPEQQVVAGAGSVTLLQQLVAATAGPGDEVLFAWRSFEAYPVFPALAGATAVRVPLTPDARHDLPAMAAALTERTRLVLVCSPNNPTGPAVAQRELDTFLERVPAETTVVVDEAYHEYVDDPTAVDGLATARRHPNVAVLRTFSKAYGLAALRVGWCVAPPELADALRRTSVPFSVGTLAQRAAMLSLLQEDEVARRAAEVVAERRRVTAALRADGVRVPESQGNFVWLPVGAAARPVAAALERRGVITRPYGDDGIRITMGLPDENDLLLRALPDALADA